MRNKIRTQPVAWALCLVALPLAVEGQPPKPETAGAFECYVEAAESRMAARKSFLLADADAALNDRLVRGPQVQTIPANGANPHKIAGGHVWDWIATVFVPGVNLDRTIRMLQDYDHRWQYFTDTMSSSRLLCRTGDDHFRSAMRMKEPSVIDVESDVVWEKVDAHRWRCRSYSTSVREVGKEHGYVQRIYTYWRLAEAEKGVYIEGEGIELSNEFNSVTRALGSMMGISAEKSLRHSVESMRAALLKPGLEFSKPPANAPECGPPFHPAVCSQPRP